MKKHTCYYFSNTHFSHVNIATKLKMDEILSILEVMKTNLSK
jgi:hypothetical protein